MNPELEKIKTQKRVKKLLLRTLLFLMLFSSFFLISSQVKFLQSYSKIEESFFRLKLFDAIKEVKFITEGQRQKIDANPDTFPIYFDKELRNVLAKNGISEMPVYKLQVVSSKKILCTNDKGIYKKDLLESEYIFIDKSPNLMPNEELSLVLYFPKKQDLLTKESRTHLILSAIFIIIISSGFVYAIHIIFKQKHLSKMKNDFIDNITHEIKTPISTISLVCEILSDSKTTKPFPQEQYLKIIADENKRLQNMVEQLLQQAKLEEGSLSLSLEEIDMHEIIQKAVKTVELSIEHRNGKIYQNLEAEKAFVFGDKIHLTNVIYNLLDNASKYSENAPIINIGTKNIDSRIVICVEDNGIGISKHDQDKIFEKFYRVSTGNVHNVKGYGIGLSYVKQIIALHKGSISLKSELKKGSVFCIYLPVSTKEIQKKS